MSYSKCSINYFADGDKLTETIFTENRNRGGPETPCTWHQLPLVDRDRAAGAAPGLPAPRGLHPSWPQKAVCSEGPEITRSKEEAAQEETAGKPSKHWERQVPVP